MRNIFIILMIVLSGKNLLAQEPLTTYETKTLSSKVLGEERIIDIQVPKDYNNPNFSKSKFPVLYVLDGESNFTLLAALERYGTKFLYRYFPEMIVVGIRNIDRTRDFTPTKPSNEPNPQRRSFENGGGAENFTQFIQAELQPYIEKTYRTNQFNILHGHSFGGLFTIYTMLNHPQLFSAYIAIDPSLWWDNKIIYRQAKESFLKQDYNHKSLFIALAYEDEDNKRKSPPHGSIIKSFCTEILPINPKKNLNSYWRNYPDYDHGSIPVPSSFDALSTIFTGIQLPIKQIPESPSLLNDQYRKLSQKLNFDIKPEESLLMDLILYNKRIKQDSSAKEILDYALQIYPDSPQLNKLADDDKK